MKTKAEKKEGRPSKYTVEIADIICDIIANSSRGLQSIADELELSRSTIHLWLVHEDGFSDKYARAKESQAHFMADETIGIADDSSRDTKIIKGKDGKDIEVENTEWVNRSRLRIDTRKWLAGKLLPKKYGDKIQTEHSGDVTIKQITGMDIK